MRRKFAYIMITAAMAAGAAIGTAGSAAAAHCVEGDTPGFSYFGTVHVKESTHAEGGNPGPHAGTSGASNCRATTGSPSERAPGRP